MKSLALAVAAFSIIGLLGCDEEMERMEVVSKLRAIGVSANPVTATPGATVQLTFHLALPTEQTVSEVEAFVDDGVKNALALPVVVDSATASYEDHAKLRIYKVAAALTVPTEIPVPADGFLPIRYGLTVRADQEEEKIVGNIIAYPAGSTPTSWQAHTSSIAEPTAAQSVGKKGKLPLSGAIERSIEENMRVGWYASAGKVKNRNARSTEWEAPDESGVQTVIFTSRGLKSGAFDYKIVDVSVE